MPYANVIICICKYANVPAPVAVAGGREPKVWEREAKETRSLGAGEGAESEASCGGRSGNEAGRGSGARWRVGEGHPGQPRDPLLVCLLSARPEVGTA